MKQKLVYKEITGWNVFEKLAQYIIDNDIQHADVLKIIHGGGLHLYYYVNE